MLKHKAGLAQSLWGLWVLVHTRFYLSPRVYLAGMEFDLNEISLLLLSCWGFSFTLGCGVSFFGRIQHSPVDGCSAANRNFGVLTGENEHMSFYFIFLAVTLLRHIFILSGLAFKVFWAYPNKCLAYD